MKRKATMNINSRLYEDLKNLAICQHGNRKMGFIIENAIVDYILLHSEERSVRENCKEVKRKNISAFLRVKGAKK